MVQDLWQYLKTPQADSQMAVDPLLGAVAQFVSGGLSSKDLWEM